MDEILDFFNAKKPIVRKNVFGGTSSVCKAQTASPANRNDDKFANDTKYAESYATENDRLLIEKYGNEESSADEEFCYRSVALYKKYNFNCTPPHFPIFKHRAEILETIENNCFTILQGPTGCGKTTQLPQYILDDAYSKGKRCNIIVAQPTRIATSSNATRICDERKLKLGQLIGYKVGFDENMYMNKDTRLLFCTTGVLLSKLIQAKHFGDWTHIILDEIHERNIHMDFLFIIIRKLLVTVEPRPTVKFILMSATIQAEQFSNYFTFPKNGQLQPAPVITIDQRSKFIIREYFIEQFIEVAPKIDIRQLNSYELNISDELFMIALHLICHFDKIDTEYCSDDEEDTCVSVKRQTVLVFLPGIHEMARMETILKEYWIRLNKETKIMPIILHSMSDSQQRSLVFRETNANVRKIILATNIAESSITVPDVAYVLDFCRTKLLVTDSATNFTSLQLSWASQSNCKQRAGRTGRVMDGRVYRFVRKDFYNHYLEQFAVPEIVNSPLENVILSAKLLDMGSPASLLSLALDKPKLSDIANTILVLKEIGALLRTCNGTWSDMDGDISLVGKHMANLPIDVRIAKFIILGYCFSILDECIIIGAALNSRSFFTLKNNGRPDMRLYSHQLLWANGSGSDLVASLHAYIAWQSAHNSGLFGQNNSGNEARLKMKEAEREWGHKYCLDIDALNECHVQVNELKVRLKAMNIEPSNSTNHTQWNVNEKAIILKVVIAGAFYPNYFVRTSSVKCDDSANEMFKSIGTRDPRTTVYYTGFPREYCRQLYIKSIKEIFIGHGVVDRNDADRIRVNFDPNSNKMFITFKEQKIKNKENLMPGSVCMEVYKALKLRDLKLMCDVWIIGSIDDEINYCKQINFVVPKIEEYYESRARKELNDLCIPKIFDVNMKGFITHIDSCSRFWFQPEIEFVKVQEFEDYLKNYRKTVLRPLSKNDRMQVGKVLIVAISDCSDLRYHRAKIVAVTAQDARYKVKMIDFGKVIDCSENQFYEYCGTSRKFIDLPPRCFECGLAKVQPSQIRYPDGLWPNAAIDLLKFETNQRLIEIMVYSLTNGKSKVFISIVGSAGTLNDILVKQHFGEYVEEDFLSKTNHIHRKTQREQNLEHIENENFIDPMYLDYLFNKKIDIVTPPPPSMCNKKFILSGPYSPISSKVCAITEAVKHSTVNIDRFSVNSILMDNDPQDSTQKILVAASVCFSDVNKANLNLRYTTLMPNIRGFGALSALMFCPTMQIKTNKSQTNYTALRTGLGYDNAKKRPVFPEHDMQFHLDVEITQHDIEIINQIRYSLDTLLLTCSDEKSARQLSENAKYQILNKIKSLITKLLEKQRKSIDIDPTNTNIEWDPNFEKLPHFSKSMANDIYGCNAIYPLHGTLQTKSIRDTDRDFLRLHCKQLHLMAKISTTLPANVSCELCQKNVKSVDHLKEHLTESEHIDNELHIELSEISLN